MNEFNFDPENTYLVAATYGPASMALLYYLVDRGAKPVVLFIDYGEGPVDESKDGLAKFCEKYGLILEIKEAHIPQDKKGPLSRSWARDARYAFFREMYTKYDASAICLAHIQDDVIENYLLTKRYGGRTAIKALNPISLVDNMIVMCPMLDYSYDDILEVIKIHSIPYSWNVRDFELEATHSDIRREIVAKLNAVERSQILEEMKKENADQIEFATDVEEEVKEVDTLNVRTIMALSQDDFAETIIHFLNAKAKRHVKITSEQIKAIREMCLDPRENVSLKISGKIYLCKEYDELSVDLDGMNLPYQYSLEKPGKLQTDVFDLDFSMGAEDRGIKEEDYPITIRSALPQDVYTLGGYLIPIKQMLFASGCPQDMARLWPVFLNKKGKIVYIPRYQKNFTEYHTSKLLLHLAKAEG